MLELCNREGGKTMKIYGFQGQLPLGNVCSATEYVSEGLTLFFQNASIFIGMTPFGARTVRFNMSA
jgi:hypothetical protein